MPTNPRFNPRVLNVLCNSHAQAPGLQASRDAGAEGGVGTVATSAEVRAGG